MELSDECGEVDDGEGQVPFVGADAEAKYWRAADQYQDNVLGDLLKYEPGIVARGMRSTME